MNRNLAAKFSRFKTEVSPGHLRSQGCSPSAFRRMLEGLGFCEEKNMVDSSAGRPEWDEVWSECT
jgi:hypothetical protein